MCDFDGQGHYEVMLGSTGDEGIPMDLFSSGEPRWLGVEALLPGEDEQPRVLLVSVPYAMRAGDAATLGGLPASAYAKASNGSPVLSVPAPEPTSSNTPATATSLGGTLSSTVTDSALAGATGALNTVPKFSGPTSLVNSQITDINGMVSMQNLFEYPVRGPFFRRGLRCYRSVPCEWMHYLCGLAEREPEFREYRSWIQGDHHLSRTVYLHGESNHAA